MPGTSLGAGDTEQNKQIKPKQEHKLRRIRFKGEMKVIVSCF